MPSAKTRLLLYNSKLPNNNFNLMLGLCKALNRLQSAEAVIAHPHTLGFFLRSWKPDAVVAFGGEEITLENVETLGVIRRLHPVPWTLWTTEDPFELEVTTEIAPYFDLVLTSDKNSLSSYSAHPRSHYLPLAADPETHFRPVITDPSDLLYDLVFVGTAWPNRVGFLAELKERLPQQGHTCRFLVPTNSSLPKAEMERLGPAFERDVRVAPKDLSGLQNQSRFALTLLREFSRHSRQPRPQTSPTNRFFETALSGTGQIFVSDAVDLAAFYPELTGHIAQCHSVEEILQTLERAKDDPESRSQSARVLQEFVMNQHLYKHRAVRLLELLGLR